MTKALTLMLLAGTAVVFTFMSCKVRKVTTSIVKSSDHSQVIQMKIGTSLSLDSSTTFTSVNQVDIDTSSYEVEITPDSGTVTIIKGDYTGHASKVLIRGKGNEKKVVEQLVKQANHITTTSVTKDSTTVKKDVQQSKKDKQSTSTPSVYPWIFAILAVIAILIALYFYLRGMGLFTVGDIEKKLK
jgi:cobalamin biosynthesis Mg chelatase CobN